MQIYADPNTVNCRKVLAGLKLLEVDFELVNVDYLGGEHKGPDYLALNPNGALPAMRDGDFELWESNAILQEPLNSNFIRCVQYTRLISSLPCN